MAKEQSTRDAFLTFLTDDAVTAARGVGPRIGKKHIRESRPDSSWLDWEPVMSYLSASGDFGFNTGPWTFRQSRAQEQPIAYGQFASLWQKDSLGQWRVALDMGVTHVGPVDDNGGTIHWKGKSPAHESDSVVISFEDNLSRQYVQRGIGAYGGLITRHTRFLRPGHHPITGGNVLRSLQEAFPYPVKWQQTGMAIAPSGDIACFFGKARVITTSGETSHHSYARFWRRERSHWTIALDVISD